MVRENMSAKGASGKAAPVSFLFEGQHLVRAVLDREGGSWFVGVDVCRILELTNPNDALARLDKDERSTLAIAEGAHGGPPRIIVSEAGVFRLIFTSRKEGAERFKRWLAHEVLPTLRRTGSYRRPTKSPYFRHGELTKRIFDAMRVNGTVTSLEIAVQAMREKGLDPENDRVTRTDFVRRVTLQLNALASKGKAAKLGKGRSMRWKLAGGT